MCYEVILSVVVWGWEGKGGACCFSIGTSSEAWHGCEDWGSKEQVGWGRMRYLATLLNTAASHPRKGAPQRGRLARRHGPLRNDSHLQHNKAGTKELFFYTLLKVVLKRSCVIYRITNHDQDDYSLLLYIWNISIVWHMLKEKAICFGFCKHFFWDYFPAICSIFPCNLPDRKYSDSNTTDSLKTVTKI